MRFTKGLNKDVDPTAQPEGTYRELINGIVTDDMGTIQLEDGTDDIASLSGSIIGDIILSNNKVILFTDDNKILQFNRASSPATDTIVNDSSLNLSTTVTGTHTIDNNGDTIIYFTDGTNPPRFLNITNPPTDGSNNLTVNINSLNLFPEYNTSEVSFTLFDVESSGGSLKAGSYYLAFAYIDEDGTVTDYFMVTNPIHILGDDGRGANDNVETGKAISFTLSNLDTYEKLRISAIRETTVSNVIDINIKDKYSIFYKYTGNEDDTVGSLEEIVVNNPIYKSANAIEQHDNSLYLGGLEKKGLTRSEKEHLQKVALNTKVEAIFENRFLDFYRKSENIYNKRSFKRGEVYALYMSFILDDGRETDAFHIPGRESLNGGSFQETSTISSRDFSGNKKYQVYNRPDPTTSMGYWENENEKYPNIQPFISEGFAGENVRHHRIPGAQWLDPIYDDTSGIYITGLELSEIDITKSSLKGKVRGFKLYYADKNNPADRIILDQGSIQNGWLDTDTASSPRDVGYRPYQTYKGSRNDKTFKGSDVYCTHGFDELSEHDVDGTGYTGEEWGSKRDVGYTRPAELMITRKSIGSLDYVRGIYEIESRHTHTENIKLIRNDYINYIGSSSDQWVMKVDAKSYVDNNQRNVSLSTGGLGFSHDMDNLFGESKIIMEFGGDYAKRGFRTISDLCQLLDNVHVPFTNQTLVDTGYGGRFDNNGDVMGGSIEIWNGDTYIGDNYYKTHTLFNVYDLLANDNQPNWCEDDTPVVREWWLEAFAESQFESDDTNNSGDDEENRGCEEGIVQSIGNTQNMKALPIPIGTMYRETVESRINTSILYSGENNYESVYPQKDINDWTVQPNINDIKSFNTDVKAESREETLAWCEYFKKTDNYPEWNDQYQNLQTVKTSFPWNPFENISKNFYNRVIRSASDSEDGRSESFREFREDDFLDVPRNRGQITNLENINNNLAIHMDRALLFTRGRQELQTQNANVFLGSGNIFSVKPNEVLITDAGYGGLQHSLASVNCKYGYFFVDEKNRRILWFNKQLNDLTTKQFGLHNYFREEFDFTNTIVGYDSNRERVIISSDNDTIVFNPDLQIWSTELSYNPDYMFRTLNTFYTEKSNIIYKHEEGRSSIYGSPISFNITYAVLHGFNAKVNHLWFNADYFNYGSITEDIPFNTIRIRNSHQNTGNINLTDYSTIDPTGRGNIRKSQGLWRVNNIRVPDVTSGLPSWANQKRLEDDYHIVTLSFTNTPVENDSIKLKSSNLEVNQTIK